MTKATQKRFDSETHLWTGIERCNDIISWERKRRLEILEEILAKSKKEKFTILEVGCGAGLNISRIAKAHPNWECQGIDFSPKMIEVCKREHKSIKNLRFDIVDIQKRHLGKKFDFIFLLGVFGYIDNKKSSGNIDRMLKDGGKLYFTYGNRRSPYRFLRASLSFILDHVKFIRDVYNFIKIKVLRQKVPYDPRANRFRSNSPEEMKRLFSKYNILEEYNLCFSSGIFGKASVYWSQFQERIFKRDRLNFAMTKILYLQKK